MVKRTSQRQRLHRLLKREGTAIKRHDWKRARKLVEMQDKILAKIKPKR